MKYVDMVYFRGNKFEVKSPTTVEEAKQQISVRATQAILKICVVNAGRWMIKLK